jgi:hypothetical protein
LLLKRKGKEMKEHGLGRLKKERKLEREKKRKRREEMR